MPCLFTHEFFLYADSLQDSLGFSIYFPEDQVGKKAHYMCARLIANSWRRIANSHETPKGRDRTVFITPFSDCEHLFPNSVP